MMLQILAAAALLVFLWSLFRFAMGLRWAKLSREQARGAEQKRGRRVVAEIPGPDDLLLFLEDVSGFYWRGQQAEKSAVVGARVLLNGGLIGSFARGGAALPELPPAEEHEGQQSWQVVVYLRDARPLEVPCGSLREGVSREIAMTVFEAVRRAVSAA